MGHFSLYVVELFENDCHAWRGVSESFACIIHHHNYSSIILSQKRHHVPFPASSIIIIIHPSNHRSSPSPRNEVLMPLGFGIRPSTRETASTASTNFTQRKTRSASSKLRAVGGGELRIIHSTEACRATWSCFRFGHHTQKKPSDTSGDGCTSLGGWTGWILLEMVKLGFKSSEATSRSTSSKSA